MARDLTPVKSRSGGGFTRTPATTLIGGNFSTLPNSRPLFQRNGGRFTVEFLTLLAEEGTPVESAEQVEVTTQDITQYFDRTITKSTFNLSPVWTSGPSGVVPSSYTYSSLSPSASVSDDVATSEVDGQTVTIQVAPSGRELIATTEITTSVTVEDVESGDPSFVAGSLRASLNDILKDAALTSPSTDEALNRFSSRSFDGSGDITFSLNPDFYLKDYDLTCCSIGNSAGGGQRGGTLISPRHILFANHFIIPDGSRVYYVDNSGSLVTRVLTSSMQVGTTDIQIGILASDVPAGVSFAKVLGTNETLPAYLPQDDKRVPFVHGGQTGRFPLAESNTAVDGEDFILNTSPSVDWITPYTRPVVTGDSGSPMIHFVDAEPVLMASFYIAQDGPATFAYVDQINAAMTTLGGGYQLTLIDLNPFTSY